MVTLGVGVVKRAHACDRDCIGGCARGGGGGGRRLAWGTWLHASWLDSPMSARSIACCSSALGDSPNICCNRLLVIWRVSCSSSERSSWTAGATMCVRSRRGAGGAAGDGCSCIGRSTVEGPEVILEYSWNGQPSGLAAVDMLRYQHSGGGRLGSGSAARSVARNNVVGD